MELQEYINQVFEQARTAKMIKTRAEFADLLEINRSSLSAALSSLSFRQNADKNGEKMRSESLPDLKNLYTMVGFPNHRKVSHLSRIFKGRMFR